jgi:phosphoribosylformylglycinamidine synthase subunit PurL
MMNEPIVNLELALQHGLTEEEYEKIKSILKRNPTFTELGIFSVMWSEHCSYKNSIALIKTLPRTGSRLLVGAGEENAGMVDIGDDLAVVFKIESHNHPSAVEPYQGAATGVGGIMRDIFTMGARPIAGLNSLRFGNLDDSRNRFLFSGVVKGVGDYGNAFGVPNVGGEVYFEDCYNDNPLLNAMAVGIVKKGKSISATAEGKGNTVMIVGSSTGRDGIHGATFASEEISEKSESKRPSVQVGDPFTEKLLLEATLEIIREELAVGIQDMGAAGITCSTSEMSAKGKSGMDIEINKIPAREEGMTPYEIMLSESQERMLVVSKPGCEEKIKAIFTKWGLNAVEIGVVTDDKMLRVKCNGIVVAEIPADTLALGGGAPVYYRETKQPAYLPEIWELDESKIKIPSNLSDVLVKLISTPNIANKRWVYEQYDTMVRTNTVVLPGCDGAVVRIKDTTKALAMKTDCNGRYVYLDPKTGAKIAVAESARNVVCCGAEPIAITNCLNFGNPYKPEVYWQFKQAIEGIGEACRVFDTPVTGGNVSFYNESPNAAVYPTPVIGMLGLISDVKHITTSYFKDEEDVVILIGENKNELGGSEYLNTIHKLVKGKPPAIDLDYEKRVQSICLKAIKKNIIKSAHDIADGGLAVALAECCIMNTKKPIGAEINLDDDFRADALLFGETQSRIIISMEEKNYEILQNIAEYYGVKVSFIGRVGGNKLQINDFISCDLDQLSGLYYNTISVLMNKK